MKKSHDTYKFQQAAFIVFLILLGAVIAASAGAQLLRGFSALQATFLFSLGLMVATLLLWFSLKFRLDAQKSTYLDCYQQQLKKKSDFLMGRNGTLTDSKGNPVPRSAQPDSKPQSTGDCSAGIDSK